VSYGEFESANAADDSGKGLEILRAWNRIQKVPPGEAAHFFSACAWSRKVVAGFQ
jgi:hypothetical protein